MNSKKFSIWDHSLFIIILILIVCSITALFIHLFEAYFVGLSIFWLGVGLQIYSKEVSLKTWYFYILKFVRITRLFLIEEYKKSQVQKFQPIQTKVSLEHRVLAVIFLGLGMGAFFGILHYLVDIGHPLAAVILIFASIFWFIYLFLKFKK